MYAGHDFTSTERNYSKTEREALAVVIAVENEDLTENPWQTLHNSNRSTPKMVNFNQRSYR